MNKKKKSGIITLILYVVLIGAIIIAIASLFSSDKNETKFTYSDMIAQFEDNKVYGFIGDPNEFKIWLFETQEDWDNYHDGDKKNDAVLADRVKVAELSELLGYNDPSYFCRVFKKVTGMSPTEYAASIQAMITK